MKQEFEDIINKNHISKIKEFARVYTYANYLHQNNLEIQKLFINKYITVDNLIALVAKDKRAPYIIDSDLNSMLYLAFYLNSAWGKASILPSKDIKTLTGTTNIHLLNNASIIRNTEIEPYCILVEQIIEFLKIYLIKYGENADNHTDTIKRFFENLRNAIVMELILPKVFQQHEISIIYPWILEVNSVKDKENKDDLISQIFESLINPGNQLMENLNKMRFFVTRFTKFLNEYYGSMEN